MSSSSRGTTRNIIVVTGLPACGKTKIAASIAWWLSCSLISLEDILEGLRTTAGNSLPPPTSREANDLVRTGMRILLNQVASHIARSSTKDGKDRRRLCDRCIVLDFPFAYVSKLERLSVEWSMNHEKVVHIILIKCRPLNERHWRMVFDQAARGMSTNSNWFKPKSWDEIQKTIKQDDEEDKMISFSDGKEMVRIYMGYNGLEAKSISPHASVVEESMTSTSTHLVSTVVIDPFTCVKPTRKYSGSAPDSYLFYAVYYLLIERDVHEKGPCCINLQSIGWDHCEPADHVHEYVWFKQRFKELNHKTKCGECGEQLMGPSSYCQCTSCPLGFHVECIEAMYSENVYFPSDAVSKSTLDGEANCGPKSSGECKSYDDQSMSQSDGLVRDSPFRSNGRDDGEILSIGRSNSNTKSIDELLSLDKARIIRMFQGLHTCGSCTEYCRSQHKNNVCLQCRSCLVEHYVDGDFWPSELIHPLYRHELTLENIRNVNFFIPHSCAACGQLILQDLAAYCCMFCNTYFMISCIFLPMEIANDHVGYNQHPMQLRFSPHDEEEVDNYICHICWEERDPQLWYYYCKDCDYSAHINCVFELNVRVSNISMVEPHSGSSDEDIF